MIERSRHVTRRQLLRTGAGVATGLLVAGCSDRGRTGQAVNRTDESATGTDENAGGRVYVPPHIHDRRIAGIGAAGGYAVGLGYSVPDYYWTVDGNAATKVTPENDDNIQLLGYVWAPDGGPAVADVELRATITNDGETVGEPTLVPMLSQHWGLFYGGNLTLGTYTDYRIEFTVSGGDARRTREYGDAFRPGSTTVTLDFDRGKMDSIRTTYLDAADKRGAVTPLTGDDLPTNQGPDPSSFPGTVVARGRSGAAKLTVLALSPDESPLADGAPYLAVVATTPFNGFALPSMTVAGTLRRNGETVYDGAFEPTLDPDLGHHHGAAVEGIEGDDTLAVSFPTPPQVARREGYETAFLAMPDTELSLER